ncbi:hypothetical protein [Puniceibacterium sediminis]|uniref:Uncharacterized protein n=1 Tax=Puniceibacterium sediminis TaxID=1608407 RepID=A0A238YN61_9RHOB|nr:hypothetical protein [Puniceibacterium sediminis]SNR71869.1 hypothetical protein SAMN06265370_11814 [Puniceibacterium sediminis]
MTDHNIGVDISKSHLGVFQLKDSMTKRFDNSVAGFRALARWLCNAQVARVVICPLGEGEPLQERRFAEAHGTRAKTNAVGSLMLALMGPAFNLEPQAPFTPQ